MNPARESPRIEGTTLPCLDAGASFARVSVLEDSILKNLRTFVGFARQRVGDARLAEDVVQESLVNVLAAKRKPTGAEDTSVWFYRILRRTIIDLYRRNDARQHALDRFEQELPETPTAVEERLLCGCFNRLLPSVPSRYRELLQQIDLEGKQPAEMAAALGVTKSNLTVRLHRACKPLREILAQNCRACRKHGGLGCTCAPTEP
jgi:RNA polymerase sigma-70 factor (ECF subfamily)